MLFPSASAVFCVFYIIKSSQTTKNVDDCISSMDISKISIFVIVMIILVQIFLVGEKETLFFGNVVYTDTLWLGLVFLLWRSHLTAP